MSYERVEQLLSRLIIGSKQSIKAMKSGEVTEVFIANDADRHVTDKVIKVATELNIPYVIVDSKKKLGAACKIDVNASTVAVRHEE